MNISGKFTFVDKYVGKRDYYTLVDSDFGGQFQISSSAVDLSKIPFGVPVSLSMSVKPGNYKGSVKLDVISISQKS